MQGEAAVGEQAHVDDRLGLTSGAKGEHCQGDEPQGQRPDDSAGDCCAWCLGCAHERGSFPVWVESSEFSVTK